MVVLKWIVDKLVLWNWKRYCDSFAKYGTTDEKTMKLYFKWSRIHRIALKLEQRKEKRKWQKN